jgi:hypothetical protein
MKLFTIAVCLLLMVFASPEQANAQTADNYDQYISLLRKDLRSGKKQLIAANMTLTDGEAQKFWPVYDRYAAEIEKLNTDRIAIIKEYAANFDKLTDAEAASLNKRSIANDNSVTSLRQKFAPQFGKTLGGKNLARFFQIDKRLGLLIDLQLASEIPIVEP